MDAGGGRRAPDPGAARPPAHLFTRRHVIVAGIGVGMVAAGAGAAISAFASDAGDTITVWKLAADWDEPRGPSRKTRLTSHASRAAAENRYALTESDALDMNLHVGSWAPAIAVVVNRSEFETLWDSLSYDWHNPWNASDVRLFDARHAARDSRDANLLVDALTVTTTTTTTTSTSTSSTTTVPSTTVPSTTAPATTVPSTTVPATTVPSTTVPSTTVPSTTAPATTDGAASLSSTLPADSTTTRASTTTTTTTTRGASTTTTTAPTTTEQPGEESRPEAQWWLFPTVAPPTTMPRIGASRTATPSPVAAPHSSDGSSGRWVASIGTSTALVALAAAFRIRVRRGSDTGTDGDSHPPRPGESTPSEGAPIG